MNDLVFLDTETLGLHRDAPIWEIAAIRVDGETHRTVDTFHCFVHHDPYPWLNELPEEFREDRLTRFDLRIAYAPGYVVAELVRFMAGRPRVIGANPSFDTTRIHHQLLAPRGLVEPWHYHTIDVSDLIFGFLAARGRLPDCPWTSDALSAALGVKPELFPRHTAMGDVEWCKAQYERVMDSIAAGAAVANLKEM